MRVALIAIVMAALVAGCGGDDDGGDGGNGAAATTAATENEYATQGNTICREARTQVDALALAQPPTLEDLREKTPAARNRVRLWTVYSTKVDEIGRKSQTDLLALEPPAELRGRRDRLEEDLDELDRVGAQANKSGNRLRAAARAGDDAALEKARGESQKLAERQAAIANRVREHFTALGWTACLQGQ